MNQLLDFGLLGFPLDGHALSWGLALGLAALSAVAITHVVLAAAPETSRRLVLAFALAFCGFEALLFAFALVAGGTETFAPHIVLRLLANESAWLAGLAMFNILLARVSPRLFGRAPVLHRA